MRTVGIVHRIDANAGVRTEVVDADDSQSVLDVLRAIYGPVLTAADLLEGNRLPSGPDDPASADHPFATIRPLTWGRWVSLNPVTVLGARAFNRRTGTIPVAVIAGPDSGYSIGIDPDRPLLSRTAQPDCLCIVDPCLSRQITRMELDPSGHRPFSIAGTTILLPVATSAPVDTALDAVDDMTTTEVAPDPVAEPRPARPPQWWTFLIPIVIGIVLAVATGMWWFLLFSASAPLSGYVAYRMERRRFVRDSARFAADRTRAVDDARDHLAELIAEHRVRLRTRRGLCLGFGESLLPLTVSDELRPGIDHLGGRVVIDDVPLRIDPMTTAVTVTGDFHQVRCMALAWLADQHWSWSLSSELDELPELQGTRYATGTQADRLSVGISLHRSAEGTQATLLLEPPTSKARVSLTLNSVAQAHVRTSTLVNGPVQGRGFVATLMPPGRFLTLERDRTEETARSRFPSHGLGDHYDDSPEAINRRWDRSGPGPVTIGRGVEGEVTVDLFHDGPHALVAGTTGSGKSILLQTWLLAMALENPSEQLSFVLIDFKGGATFAPLAGLPHTDCVLDDFDSAATFRALISVRAEITRRERLLADHGCANVLGLKDPPPRLVVVIDEFHALMASHPKAAELIEHLTALGRSLAVHLILATQRPLGVVTGHMKANINIRICLRVRDDADSFDVLGINAAAHLPASAPGAACMDSGTTLTRFRVATPIIEVPLAEVVLRPRVRPWDPAQTVMPQSGMKGVTVENIARADRDRSQRNGQQTRGENSGHHHRDSDSKRRIVLPPLPSAADLEARMGTDHPCFHTDDANRSGLDDANRGGSVVSGIIDFPASQRQDVWSYRPDTDGSLLAVGAEAHIIASALARLAASASATHRTVAIGRSADVLDWAEIRCGMDSGWKLRTIIDHLRQPRPVPTLVVCDNWSEFVDSLDHHTAGEFDLLLKHAPGLGLTFLVGGSRTSLNVNGPFASQLIFPPYPGADGMSVGLARQRFLGSWPRFRAVLTGPSAEAAGREGADVQLVPHSGPPAGIHRLEPRWVGLDAPPLDPPSTPAGTDRVPLGRDPFGELVTWDTVRDGPVLTVRGSPRSGKSALVSLLHSREMEIACHDDAHLKSVSEPIDLLDGAIHALSLPLRHSPGYSSPLAKARDLGPLLILGAHTRQDLSNLGLPRLPPLDGGTGVGWFVTEAGMQAVRVFTPRSRAESRSDQKVSAGGPVNVS